VKIDLGVMAILCLLILVAVLAANGRLQNVINAYTGGIGPGAANTSGGSWDVGIGVQPPTSPITSPIGVGQNF